MRPWRAGRLAWIFAAHDSLLGRPVALKQLRPLEQAFQEAEARMRREAATLAKLDHPSIVRVFDVMTDPHLVLVEELVEGRDLEQLRAERGTFPWKSVAAIGAAIAGALAHAHSKEVLHRDLHPSDILLDPQGIPRLLDFGYASWKSVAGQTLGGPVLARLDYAAEEVIQGKEATEASDLFSLGVILYELLSGKLPHPKARPFQRPPKPPSLKNQGDLPEAFADLLEQLLSRDPSQRPQMTRVLEILPALGKSTGPSLESVAAFLGVVRNAAHPLKNRLALVKRYPDDPEKVRRLIQRDSVRLETLELLSRSVTGFGKCLHALPLSGETPRLKPLKDLQALLEDPALPDPVPVLSQAFEVIRQLVNRGVELGKKHTVSLDAWSAEWAKQQSEIALVLGPTAELPAIWTEDASTLLHDFKEVLSTLVNNSLEAGANEIQLQWDRDPRSVLLRLRDNGPGIPKEVQPKLFHHGATSKKDGSGLGLSDARQRMRSHHGDLSAEPSQTGAQFLISLPIRPWETQA